jgi:hypothetical protein
MRPTKTHQLFESLSNNTRDSTTFVYTSTDTKGIYHSSPFSVTLETRLTFRYTNAYTEGIYLFRLRHGYIKSPINTLMNIRLYKPNTKGIYLFRKWNKLDSRASIKTTPLTNSVATCQRTSSSEGRDSFVLRLHKSISRA